ncbi:MAG: hypothetical protein MJZ37_08490 [Bacilli bacterium]|nr:hypothetical protein [Bacilli bacterium]
MSFKIKDKTITITLMSIITLIVIVVFSILVLCDTKDTYTETFKNIVLVVVGSFFNNPFAQSSEKDVK